MQAYRSAAGLSRMGACLLLLGIGPALARPQPCALSAARSQSACHDNHTVGGSHSGGQDVVGHDTACPCRLHVRQLCQKQWRLSLLLSCMVCQELLQQQPGSPALY